MTNPGPHDASMIEKEKAIAKDDIAPFPKRIGIVFIEDIENKNKKPKLEFNQIACAHLLLQMNGIQQSFELQIIKFRKLPNKTQRKNLLEWFDIEISLFEKTKDGEAYGIDYWIAITSEELLENLFLNTIKIKSSTSGKRLWVITSHDWERYMCPPSLFEYICISVFTCILHSIFSQFRYPMSEHKGTKGCIFDWTGHKPHRRILVSNPNLCSWCENRLSNLERSILTATGTKSALYQDVNKILSKEWMGSTEKKESPIYNLKKNYRYDIDRNSGFYKKWWERIRDKIEDHSITAIVTMLGVIATAIFLNLLNLRE